MSPQDKPTSTLYAQQILIEKGVKFDLRIEIYAGAPVEEMRQLASQVISALKKDNLLISMDLYDAIQSLPEAQQQKFLAKYERIVDSHADPTLRF